MSTSNLFKIEDDDSISCLQEGCTYKNRKLINKQKNKKIKNEVIFLEENFNENENGKKVIYYENSDVVFYFYEPGGSGKSGLVTELFGNELYKKLEIIKSEPDYWDGYNGQDIILFDECDTKINYSTLINFLNGIKTHIETKNEFVLFCTKYIFMTSTKTPGEAFGFDDSNKRDLDNNNLERRTTEIIFHKGDERKFCNIEWNIEYQKGQYNFDTINEEQNKNIDGYFVIDNGKIYFQQKFPDYIKKYLLDFSNSKPLSEYKNEKEQKEFLKLIIIKLENYNDLQKMCFFERDNEILNLDDFHYEQDGNSCTPQITIAVKERKWFLIDNDSNYNFYYKNQKFLNLEPRQYKISHCGINGTNDYIFFMCENKKIQKITNSYTCEFNGKSLEKKIVNRIECFKIIDIGKYTIYKNSTKILFFNMSKPPTPTENSSVDLTNKNVATTTPLQTNGTSTTTTSILQTNGKKELENELIEAKEELKAKRLKKKLKQYELNE
ncbi:12489_t:CDS:2 [Cetraspora pellucida]|uniref:12489_t:CDS:1 n=1 Tax=Cetraspora pellucida TaxID=1433469 RepID=A0A9N9IXI1_9GLOM|nr:12489_t:CDS:2 [Cetraspora pellucida]